MPGSDRSFLVLQGPNHSLHFAAIGETDDAVTAIPGNSWLPPATVADPVNDTIDVVATSANGGLYFASIGRDGVVRRAWRGLPGRLASSPALVWDPTLRKIHVVGRSAGDQLWFGTLDPNGTLVRPWIPLAGKALSAPAAVWDAPLGEVALVVRGPHNALYFGSIKSDGSTGTGLREIGGSTPASPAATFDTTERRLYVFVRGEDDELWFSRLDARGSLLESWKAVPGVLRSAPFAGWDAGSETAYITALMHADSATARVSAYMKRLPVGGAEFVTQRVSARKLRPRQRLTVTIGMRNVSRDTWTARGGFALAYQDGFGRPAALWGVTAVPLGPADAIEPGHVKAFTFTVATPPAEGVYDLRWRMTRHGTPFGEVSNSMRVSVDASST
jgi:hypothetical protein